MVGFDEISFSDFQSSDPVWTPPAALTAPVVVADGVDAEASTPVAPTNLQPGGRARNATNSRVNIRLEPGYLGKADGDILIQMDPNETVEVLGWSRPADNLIWWPVRYQTPNGTPVEGWVAESTSSGVQILVPLP